MRLTTIHVESTPPIQYFHVTGLSDVVFVGGPNGVGKTRLLSRLINFFRKPEPSDSLYLTLDATNDEERADWGKQQLDTRDANDCKILIKTLQKNRYRSSWQSGVIYFESDRTIKQVNPYQFSWAFADPDTESISWDTTITGLQSRWQDTLHTIFRRIELRRRRIADKGEALLSAGESEMPLSDFPDPLEPFRSVFAQLLRPKTLIRAHLPRQTLYYKSEAEELDIKTLSSGESEVLNMAFDFTAREPRDCIVLFDEPELHLHPELSQAMIQTLRTIGARNQFMFCTHSPDLIASGLDDTVVFLGRPGAESQNQAIVVEEDDQTNAALKRLGHSIGIISLGRRIVLIEGNKASLDKKVYDAIVRTEFPEFVLVPSGGRDLVANFAALQERLLSKTIWGVEFFMLCDQDMTPPGRAQCLPDRRGRLRTLERYHLENYFLDEFVWAEVFRSVATQQEKLLKADAIRETLVGMAGRLISYATALHVAAAVRERVGNIDVMPKNCDGVSVGELVDLFLARVTSELERVGTGLEAGVVVKEVENTYQELREGLTSETWKKRIPGKPIVDMLANKAGMKSAQLKTLYIREAETSVRDPFDEIKTIFRDFREEAALPPHGVGVFRK